MKDRKVVVKFLSEDDEKKGMNPDDCFGVNTTLLTASLGIKRISTDEEKVAIAKFLVSHLKGVNIVVADMIPF